MQGCKQSLDPVAVALVYRLKNLIDHVAVQGKVFVLIVIQVANSLGHGLPPLCSAPVYRGLRRDNRGHTQNCMIY